MEQKNDTVGQKPKSFTTHAPSIYQISQPNLKLIHLLGVELIATKQERTW